MALPTSGSLDEVWPEILRTLRGIKSTAQTVRDVSAAGNIRFPAIALMFRDLDRLNKRLAQLTGTPGLLAYARNQVSDPNLDLVAEFNAMQAQLDATIAWVKANIPASNGFLLVQSINDTTNQFEDREFTTAQTASLRTTLDALLATLS